MLYDCIRRFTQRLSTRLFAAFVAIYAITASGGYEVSDAVLRYETAKSWVDGRGGALSAAESFGDPVVSAPDGRHYAPYGPLQSVLMTPVVMLATMLTHGSPANLSKLLFGILVIPCVSALSMALLFQALCDFGYSLRVALWTTLVIGLATPMWHYGRSGQEENMIGFAFAIYLLGIAKLRRRQFDGLILISLAAGIVFATRMAYVPAIAVLLCGAAVELWKVRAEQRAWRKPALLALGLGSATIGAIFAYNQHRFGSLLESGYGLYFRQHHMPMFIFSEVPENAAALLVSPFRGILWFCPTLLILFGLPRARRCVAVDALWPFILAAWAFTLIFIASYRFWAAAFAWGPRYLVAPIVLLAPLFAAVFASGQKWRAVTALSVLVQFFSVLLPSATENYVYTDALQGPCSPWLCRCTALCLRPRRGVQALVNTVLGRHLSVIAIDNQPLGQSASQILETSDYRSVYWWPVRTAYRAHLLPPPLAFVLCLVVLGAAAYAIHAMYRVAFAAERRATGL